MLAIFKREFRGFFHGMMGYLLTAFLAASSGLYFLALNLGYGLTDFSYYTLYRTIFMLLLYVPVLTMRSLAEERRSRTDQLLLTSPVSVWGIVLGKFFSMCAVFSLACLLDLVMILVLWALGATATTLAANLAGLALMGWDKRCARRGRRRIPEKALFLAALLGGAAGCWAGMYLFRHKTRHWYFAVGMPLILACQIALAVWLCR